MLELLGGKLNSTAWELYTLFGFVAERRFEADEPDNGRRRGPRRQPRDRHGVILTYMTKRCETQGALLSVDLLREQLKIKNLV